MKSSDPVVRQAATTAWNSLQVNGQMYKDAVAGTGVFLNAPTAAKNGAIDSAHSTNEQIRQNYANSFINTTYSSKTLEIPTSVAQNNQNTKSASSNTTSSTPSSGSGSANNQKSSTSIDNNKNSGSYGKGSVTINGEVYSIYVPDFKDGSNANFNDNDKGWVSSKSIEADSWDTNVAMVIGTFGQNTQTTVAESSENDIGMNNNVAINKNISVNTLASSNGKFNSGLTAAIELGWDLANNTQRYLIQLVPQKNGNRRRVVIQVSNTKSPFSCSQGYSLFLVQ